MRSSPTRRAATLSPRSAVLRPRSRPARTRPQRLAVRYTPPRACTARQRLQRPPTTSPAGARGCEAAFAGALGVRLGGTNVYGGVIEDRPQLGNGRPAAPADIRRAVRLSRAVTWAAVAVSAILAAASDWRRPAR